jgi:hypothetical protein
MGSTHNQIFCASDTNLQHDVMHRVIPQRMQTSAAVSLWPCMSEEASLSATTAGLIGLHGNRV